MILLGPIGLIASLIVAVVFFVAGAAKLADRSGTLTAVQEFGAPSRFAPFLASALPVAELGVAATLVFSASRTIGALAALFLLVVFSGAIAIRLARGSAPECHCFGQLHSAPVSWKSLARNAGLAVLAGAALSAGLKGETPSAFAWIGGIEAVRPTEILLLVVWLATVAGGAVAFVILLRSYGKVLLRLDQLELRLQRAGLNVDTEELSAEVGHAPGMQAPAFAAADTNGRETSLADLLAPQLPLVLLFTSPDCAPCKSLLPKVAAWQNDHAELFTIAILSSGDRQATIAEANEQRLERVLADESLAIFEAYQASGTPSAVLVSPDGRIASYVAAGSESVEQLVLRSVSELAPGQQQGLSIGSSAPHAVVPRLDGPSLDIASLREETLLLFWNPGCGFCRSMRDDVLAWERNAPIGAPRLVVVSTGDENSVRAEGFTSTVVLDPNSEAAAMFGAGGTPMGLLIDKDARIASSLAAGAEAVFTLAGGRSRAASLSAKR